MNRSQNKDDISGSACTCATLRLFYIWQSLLRTFKVHTLNACVLDIARHIIRMRRESACVDAVLGCSRVLAAAQVQLTFHSLFLLWAASYLFILARFPKSHFAQTNIFVVLFFKNRRNVLTSTMTSKAMRTRYLSWKKNATSYRLQQCFIQNAIFLDSIISNQTWRFAGAFVHLNTTNLTHNLF